MRPKKITDHRPETAWSFYTQVLGASLFYNLLAKGLSRTLQAILVKGANYGQLERYQASPVLPTNL